MQGMMNKVRALGTGVKNIFGHRREQQRQQQAVAGPAAKSVAPTTARARGVADGPRSRTRSITSGRSRRVGISTVSGFKTRHDLRCDVLTGCDIFKAYAGDRLRALGFRRPIGANKERVA